MPTLPDILLRLAALQADIRSLAIAAHKKRDHDTVSELREVDQKLEAASEHITDYVLPYIK